MGPIIRLEHLPSDVELIDCLNRARNRSLDWRPIILVDRGCGLIGDAQRVFALLQADVVTYPTDFRLADDPGAKGDNWLPSVRLFTHPARRATIARGLRRATKACGWLVQRLRSPLQAHIGRTSADVRGSAAKRTMPALVALRRSFDRVFARLMNLAAIDSSTRIGAGPVCHRSLRRARERVVGSAATTRLLGSICSSALNGHHVIAGEPLLRDLDRLVVYLSSTLGAFRVANASHYVRQDILLQTRVQDALTTMLDALVVSGDDILVAQTRAPERVIDCLLRYLRVPVRHRAMGPLKGCLVRTLSGAAIHLNEDLTRAERARVIFHELAHLRLEHRSTTGVLFRPSVESLDLRRTLSRQEDEANDVADVWLHTMDGLLAYLRDREGFWLERGKDWRVRSSA